MKPLIKRQGRFFDNFHYLHQKQTKNYNKWSYLRERTAANEGLDELKFRLCLKKAKFELIITKLSQNKF